LKKADGGQVWKKAATGLDIGSLVQRQTAIYLNDFQGDEIFGCQSEAQIAELTELSIPEIRRLKAEATAGN
jgi:hypothetical protein